MTNVTAEFIAGAAGALISLIFSYLPGLRTWYAEKSATFKRLFMLGVVVLTSAGIFGLGCANILSTNLVCSKQGILQLAIVIGTALITNQSVFVITPVAPDVAEIKAGA